MAERMFVGQEVEPMSRTYVVLVCPNCRRQAEGIELRCHCAECLPPGVDALEPVEIEAVAVDDPRIIVSPSLQTAPVRVS